MIFRLSAKRVFRIQAWIAVVLTVASFSVRCLNHYAFHGHFHRPVRFLDVDNEQCIPAWYSALNLAVAAGLLICVAKVLQARGERRYRWHWWILAVGFIAMSIDEEISFHEFTSAALKHFLPTHGVLRFAWVIWAGLLALGLLVFYLKLLASLSRRRARQFVVAGVLFVWSAVGMEVVEGKVMDKYNNRDALPFMVLTHIEEFGEMFSIALFNAALIEHLAELQDDEGYTVRCETDRTEAVVV
jgi:hypothetical protein